jgi:hypothetical protein
VDVAGERRNAEAVSDDHFDPATYREWVRQEIPHDDHLPGLPVTPTKL